MAHQALARKYRPRRFADVATQEHVSETLRRSVATGRVAHAYLFCGPRGVGKTTLARVLAMALNCPERDEEGEPCGVCDSCGRIWGGHTALDVVEIDAASNRGVDDARDLRERAMYAPSDTDRFKVYIVDEAHMLTREAWNALLKILEEPPPRVIFVFATTEPQKIQQSASPILSRCQRFDFRRIGVDDIASRLSEVLAAEGVSESREALRLIARKADGGMRDGLSLLDQVLALSGPEVTLESVRRVLGLVEEERYVDLLDILLGGRAGDVFGFVDEILDEGYDLVEFYHGLVDVLRTLLRIRLSGRDAVPDLRPDVRDAYGARAEAFAASDLARMLSLASELESTGSLRRSEQPRLLLEMLLLRLAYLDRTVSLEDLIRGLGGAPMGRPAAMEGSAPFAPLKGESEKEGPPPASTVNGDREEEPPVKERTPAREEPQDSPGIESSASADGGLAASWSAVLRAGTLPPGVGVSLRAASVEDAGPGKLRLSLPPGPALERLQSDGVVRRSVVDAVGTALGRTVELEITEHEAGEVGPDTVRKGRLRDLVAQEPGLERAVEELDLELLD
jgi:DNA polymerase-3 subunit gamma/tau